MCMGMAQDVQLFATPRKHLAMKILSSVTEGEGVFADSCESKRMHQPLHQAQHDAPLARYSLTPNLIPSFCDQRVAAKFGMSTSNSKESMALTSLRVVTETIV